MKKQIIIKSDSLKLIMKILHIEDNKSISEPIGIFLESNDHKYSSETNGRKGLDLIRENHYDVILLDLSMPEFSGFDVIDGLVKDGSIKNEKIVVLTASTLTPDEMNDLRSKGVHSSLGKPILHEKLLEKLKLIEEGHTITTNVN